MIYGISYTFTDDIFSTNKSKKSSKHCIFFIINHFYINFWRTISVAVKILIKICPSDEEKPSRVSESWVKFWFSRKTIFRKFVCTDICDEFHLIASLDTFSLFGNYFITKSAISKKICLEIGHFKTWQLPKWPTSRFITKKMSKFEYEPIWKIGPLRNGYLRKWLTTKLIT